MLQIQPSMCRQVVREQRVRMVMASPDRVLVANYRPTGRPVLVTFADDELAARVLHAHFDDGRKQQMLTVGVPAIEAAWLAFDLLRTEFVVVHDVDQQLQSWDVSYGHAESHFATLGAGLPALPPDAE